MENKTAKETVQNIVQGVDRQKMDAFKLKTRSAVSGALFGGGFGYLYSNYKSTNIYATVLLGAAIGALVSNMLTVTKKED